MKLITTFLVVMLAIAGAAYATDTAITSAAEGTFPAGTSFSGISITGLQIATGSLIAADGTTDGTLTIDLKGVTVLGAQQIISIDGLVSGGSRPAANIVSISGTCSIDMGNGTPALTGIPFVATITTNAESQGTVGLILGATSLPAATITGGGMTIADLEE